jgi:HK97 family phage major capsid protein
LPAIPANHKFRLGGGRRQFNQMRGGRQFGAGMPVQMLGQPSGPSEEVGALWGAYASYMAKAATLSGGRVNPDLAFKMAKRDGADVILVRALGETTIVDGGALVPEVVLEDYIELLYANTVYLQGNPMRVTLTSGKITIPRLAAGASAAWIGESQAISSSQQKFDDVILNLRKLGIVVPYSNDLANHAITALQQLVRDDMSMQGAIKVDTALIRGDGTQYQPRGLLNSVVSGNSFAANAVLNVTNVTVDVAKMMRLQLSFNVKGTKWYWMFSPRSLMYLWSARNAVNAYIWQDELNRGTFMGRPYGVTTSIPENLGAGSDSEVYLVDMAHEIYGEGAGADGYKFSVVDGAAYYNGSSVVSGYSQDESIARLIQKCDRASRQNGKNISVLTGVNWI